MVWDVVQLFLGAPEFKKRLYSSVLAPPGKLLDFGCANGHLADAFLGFEYYGLDVDPKAIKTAAQVYKAHSNMHFVCADIRSYPFPEDYFDEVLFAGTVHHLNDKSFTDALIGLHRSLRPGGVIHLIDPVRQPSDRPAAKFLRWVDRGRYCRTLSQIETVVQSTRKFELGTPSLHQPYGALLRDCDFVHLPIRKPGETKPKTSHTQ